MLYSSTKSAIIFGTFALFYLLSVFFLSCQSPNQSEETQNPDFIYFTEDQDEIDVNGDDVLDFVREFAFYSYGGQTITAFYIRPLHNARILCDGKNKPAILSSGDTLTVLPADSLLWYGQKTNLSTCRYYYTNWIGKWPGKTGYVGVQLNIDSASYYGWIKITMDTLELNNVVFHYAHINEIADSSIVIEK